MKYLLDTHIFLWWISEPSKLLKKELKLLENSDKLIFVSVVSAWEIFIKKRLGKLKFNEDFEKIIENCNFNILSLSLNHITGLEKLMPIHQDPFDHLLISQSRYEDLVLVTRDKMIKKYDQVNFF